MLLVHGESELASNLYTRGPGTGLLLVYVTYADVYKRLLILYIPLPLGVCFVGILSSFINFALFKVFLF